VKLRRFVCLRILVSVLSLVPQRVIARALIVPIGANAELGTDRTDQSPFGWRQNWTLTSVSPGGPLHLFNSVAGNPPPNLQVLLC